MIDNADPGTPDWFDRNPKLYGIILIVWYLLIIYFLYNVITYKLIQIMQQFTLRDKISAILMDTDEKNHAIVDIVLESSEDAGLSTNDKLCIKEIWQHPTEGIIMVQVEGYSEPQELEEYEEFIPQIYEYLIHSGITLLMQISQHYEIY